MGVLYVIFDEGGGGENVPANSDIGINIELKVLPVFHLISTIYDGILAAPPAISQRVASITYSKKGINIRTNSSSYPSTSLHTIIVIKFEGNFNFDNISVNNFVRRVEVRNKEMVLVSDNGLPWGDGTYPPDAKNRAGLAGLHAAPAVINPELKTALMGDETNKERVQE